VQLAGTQISLTPLHSVTASALFTSLLSLHNNTWGVLSEGIFILFIPSSFTAWTLMHATIPVG